MKTSILLWPPLKPGKAYNPKKNSLVKYYATSLYFSKKIEMVWHWDQNIKSGKAHSSKKYWDGKGIHLRMWFKNITNWICWSYTKSLLCCEKSLEVDHGQLFRNVPLIPELSLGIYSWRDHLFYWPDLRLSKLYLIQRYMFYPNLPIIIQAAWNFPGPSPECGSNVRKKKYFVSFFCFLL